MDKIKIGKFIAECRKNKMLTQEQFAEQLHVTAKSVSKWENGYCLPDSSLYESLCSILDISINELFAGQRIPDRDYKKIADENLLKMLKYRLYSTSDKSISFDEFDNALSRIAEVTTLLKTFDTKEDAVNYLMKETICPEGEAVSLEECSKAYDFYMNMFNFNT